MSHSDLTTVLFLLLLLLGLAQLLGYIFLKLRQPKVIGEILAGIVLGPALLGRLQIGSLSILELSKHHAPILNFVYWVGLLLLMFMSGAETKQLFRRVDRGVRWPRLDALRRQSSVRRRHPRSADVRGSCNGIEPRRLARLLCARSTSNEGQSSRGVAQRIAALAARRWIIVVRDFSARPLCMAG